MGQSWPLFLYFRLFKTDDSKCSIKFFADDWIRTADLWIGSFRSTIWATTTFLNYFANLTFFSCFCNFCLQFQSYDPLFQLSGDQTEGEVTSTMSALTPFADLILKCDQMLEKVAQKLPEQVFT